jgi:chaperonin cofactor prefoldin
MSLTKLTILTLLIITAHSGYAQDTVLAKLEQIPKKYIAQIDTKADKYYHRITTKTEKALEKLSKWENKIKALLEKANPDAAQKLFGNNQLTFATLLEKYKQGKAAGDGYRKQFDAYQDKLTNSISYLDKQKETLDTKLVKPIKEVKEKLRKLGEQEDNTEAVQQFIKERKKQLFEQSIHYIGNSKYLNKINKKAYYYVETIRNYKEIFHEKRKAEETALAVLNKIPAFKNFLKANSQIASMFNLGGTPGLYRNSGSIMGLQTRASVIGSIQQQAGGGSNVIQTIQSKVQAAQEELSKLKDKINKFGGGNSDAEIPNFKPNSQKTKRFSQRLEYQANVQVNKKNDYIPTTGNFAFGVGYKITDRFLMGIGASYKMGFGTIQRIAISHQGFGIQSYIDWRLKKKIFITGGYEQNYLSPFKNIYQLQNYGSWQSSGLIGLTKKMDVKTKFLKETSIKILYDILSTQHIPKTESFVFRIGYSFK